MKTYVKQAWPVLALLGALIIVLLLNIRPYDYNVTAIFHMDARTAEGNVMPKNFVILNAPSYDGAQYYQVARNVPTIASPTAWDTLKKNPGSYAYQRFLLPLTAYLLSFGSIALLPWAFLIINVTALLLAAFLIVERKPHLGLYALALTLSPAAMVAMHFTLAEPLTIVLITAFLLRYTKHARIEWIDLLLLSGLVLAREVNILFIAFVIGFSVLKMRWKDVLLLLIPVLVFVGWHSVIYGMFGDVPFLISAEAKQFPGSAAMKVVLGLRGYDRYTLSAAALFLGFVVPGVVYVVCDIAKRKRIEILSLGALAFFGVMLLMPDYIWGSVTSIGRVITPVYPLFLLLLAERNTTTSKILAAVILLLGIATALGLAFSAHPYGLTI